MTVSPAPFVRFRVCDSNNVPLSGGKLFTYAAGTTTKLATYTDSTGNTTNTNPIILDSRGEADIYLASSLSYKFVAAPSTDTDPPTNPIWTKDNIFGAATSAAAVSFTQAATGAVQRTIQSKEQDFLSVNDFGVVGDGVTDDSAGIIASEAVPGRKFVPPETVKTNIASTALTGPFWGPGSIKDAAGNLRGRSFCAISSAPTSMGDGTTVETWANGDMSRVQESMEHRITGTATLGQPTSGYLYTPEAYAKSCFLYNSSGWNNGTADNSGRTAAVFNRVRVYQAGQGDAVAFSFSGFVTGARAGATHFLANPAVCGINGNLQAGQAGTYLNPFETTLDDGGYDVAGVHYVANGKRTVATGALYAYWAAFRAQSIGTAAMDAVVSAAGPFNVGTDYTGCNFGTNQAALALVRGHRIYGNASTTDPDQLKATSLGTDYIVNSSGGWDFYCGGVIAGRLGASGIGYPTGSGGAVTQATSKSTAVTINTVCGQITTNAAALASNAGVSFTVNNSSVGAADMVDICLASGNATAGTYNYQVDKVSAGSFVIWFKNISGGSLSESLVFNFSVTKGATS